MVWSAFELLSWAWSSSLETLCSNSSKSKSMVDGVLRDVAMFPLTWSDIALCLLWATHVESSGVDSNGDGRRPIKPSTSLALSVMGLT